MNKQSNRNKTNKLFVFDFDDTLVKADGQIHVIKSNGNKKNLTPHEFYDYCLEEGESFDFTEFDETELAEKSTIIKQIWNEFEQIYIDYGPKAMAICTARTNPNPVINFLKSYEFHDIKVGAVGVHIAGENTTETNAIKKKEWMKKLIVSSQASHVEFWDDNARNIHRVGELRKVFPQCKIITHHVVKSTG